MTTKVEILKSLINLPEEERREILMFFSNKEKNKKKPAEPVDPRFNLQYHINKLYRNKRFMDVINEIFQKDSKANAYQ